LKPGHYRELSEREISLLSRVERGHRRRSREKDTRS
jgi:hypothetical protein